MVVKFAVKKLTASDLTLFYSRFKEHPAGNQKALNLNSDVFVGKLFPDLPDMLSIHANRLKVDLFIYGPDARPEHALCRKIIKGESYKNWRLNGEFIYNPEEEPDRYSSLEPGDIAILGFQVGNTGVPDSIRMFLLSEASHQDQPLKKRVDALLGTKSMSEIKEEDIQAIIEEAALPSTHPIWDLASTLEIQVIAADVVMDKKKLRRPHQRRKISRDDLAKAKEDNEATGFAGERLVNDHLSRLQEKELICGYEWISVSDATSPYDFAFTNEKGETTRIEVKATNGPFERPFHMSLGEVFSITAEDVPLQIWRVYELAADKGKIRKLTDSSKLAAELVPLIESFPAWAVPDGFSLCPGEIGKFSESEEIVFKTGAPEE